MASAMVQSLLKGGQIRASEIACCSAADGTAEKLAADSGITLLSVSDTAPRFSTDCMVLACKPQQLATIDPFIESCSEGALLLSILAGTRMESLKKAFPRSRNVVRVMPNTPGSIGAGVSAYTSQDALSPADEARVLQVLRSMGKCLPVAESQMDAITAVSGSGPAYLFLFVEALCEAAVAQGFDPDTAMLLARETVIGSAKLLEQSPLSPAELRIQVTSPGGTTQAALECFERQAFRNVVRQAVDAARIRSVELSRMAP
jgi:pyrroline-5-carboxylate reductase